MTKTFTLTGVLLVVLGLIAASHCAEEFRDEFGVFINTFGKTYSTEEHEYRYQIFKKNILFIDEFNRHATSSSMRLGINQFADLTNQEYKSYYLGFKLPYNYQHAKTPGKKSPSPAELPSDLDWRKKGAVTEVKDQGQCGSCWAFSTTGSTEGAWKIATGKLVSLSEQNLVDCAWDFGCSGCGGGWMSSAMQYIINNTGIDSEAKYPYEAINGNCRYSDEYKAAMLSSYYNIKSGDELDLLQEISKGPVSVAIDAGHSSFQFYKTGVYFEPNCSSSVLDHGVLAVGWGISVDNVPYYIVKNSWGGTWGENGYILMARNGKNHCGIASVATRAIAPANPDPVISIFSILNQ